MSSQDQRIRQLKIKTGIVQRLHKEKKVYEKELIQQEENILKMKNDGVDEYDIRKQVEVKNESAAMIPDSIRRLKRACDDLVNLLESENDLSEVEEYVAAQKILQEANAELN